MNEYQISITTFTAEQGGRRVPFFTGYEPEISLDGKNIPAKFILPNNLEMIKPGDSATLTMQVQETIKKGFAFEIYESGHLIGTGLVN